MPIKKLLRLIDPLDAILVIALTAFFASSFVINDRSLEYTLGTASLLAAGIYWSWRNHVRQLQRERPSKIFIPSDTLQGEVVQFIQDNPDRRHYVVTRLLATQHTFELYVQNREDCMTISRAATGWSTNENWCALSCTFVITSKQQYIQLCHRLRATDAMYRVQGKFDICEEDVHMFPHLFTAGETEHFYSGH